MDRLQFSLLLSQLPALLVTVALAVCAVLAVRQRQRLGILASQLSAWGLGLIVLSRLISLSYLISMPAIMDAASPYAMISVIATVSSLVGTAGLGLIIAAVFVHRPIPQPHPVPSAGQQF